MADSAGKGNDRYILLIGVGRGGIRIAAAARDAYGFPGLLVVAADTDRSALDEARADRALLIGESWARGEGCGADLDTAERAANASADECRALLKEARMVFVAAGLGGGIGSTLPRVLARLARECAVPAVFLATTPFSFEGAKRARTAETALSLLRAESEAVIAVPNSLLFAHLPPDTASMRAFELASAQLGRALAGLAHICSARGLLTADWAGVKRMVRRPGCACRLAMGQGRGASAVQDAIAEFLACPFIGDASRLETVDAGLVTLLGGDDMTIGAVQDCLGQLQSHLPRHAEMLVGAYTDARLQGEVLLTGLLVSDERRGPGRQPDLLPSGTHETTAPKTPRRRSRRDEPGSAQDLLPFPEQQLGIFSGAPQPTFLNGENLDVPTFQRRNIPIDRGEDL